MLTAVADLSHPNAPVDFAQAARSGLPGVGHKAIAGQGLPGPAYAARRPLAQAAGLPWGAYHVGRAGDGAAPARACCGCSTRRRPPPAPAPAACSTARRHSSNVSKFYPTSG